MTTAGSPSTAPARVKRVFAVLVVVLLVLAGLHIYPFRLSAVQSTQTVLPGGTATFDIGIRSIAVPGVVGLRVTGLPDGAIASFDPKWTRGSRSLLTVTTSESETPLGSYPLVVRGTTLLRTVRTTVTLVVATRALGPPASFTISGDLATPLSPGGGGPLDLTLTNPHDADILVTALSVAVTAIEAPNAEPDRPCTVTDFAVDQFSGDFPIWVGGSAAETLTELGVPAEGMPVLRMRDTKVNQDGCKDATLTLTYTGTAEESQS